MQAAGAYLRALREGRGFTQARLAEAVGVAGNMIWRIEAGDQESKGGLLAALLVLLQGTIEDFNALVVDAGATIADAQRLASRQLLTREERDRLAALADTDPKRAALLRRLLAMADDPLTVARIEGYLDRLEERDL